MARRLGIKHAEAFWSAVLVFFTNLAAVQIYRILGHTALDLLIASLAGSSLAALAIYAKVRLSDVKKEKEAGPSIPTAEEPPSKSGQ